jgi:hypothetical protein
MDGLPKAELKRCVLIGCEARLRCTHFIGAYGKLLGSKKTLVVRFHSASLVRERIAQGDLSVWDDGAAAIGDRTLQCAASSRTLGGGTKYKET